MHHKDKPKLRNQGAAIASGVSTELIGPRMSRYALIISAPLAGRITLSFQGAAVLDQGLTLYAGQAPLYLTWEMVGDVLTNEISVVSLNANTSVGWLEIFT